MSSKDYAAAVEILSHIADLDVRLGQARRWAIYFKQDNHRFSREKFFGALGLEEYE